MQHEGMSWTPAEPGPPAPGNLVRVVTGSMSLEFCPMFGPCRLRPEAPLPASALGLARASAPARCDACPHAKNQGAVR